MTHRVGVRARAGVRVRRAGNLMLHPSHRPSHRKDRMIHEKDRMLHRQDRMLHQKDPMRHRKGYWTWFFFFNTEDAEEAERRPISGSFNLLCCLCLLRVEVFWLLGSKDAGDRE